MSSLGRQLSRQMLIEFECSIPRLARAISQTRREGHLLLPCPPDLSLVLHPAWVSTLEML